MNILRRRRRGLTLIELLVVLFILAALAGVAVGTVSNFQKKTHGSTSANSLRSADQAITAELITAGQLGDNFDGLITAAGVIPDYVANANGLVPFTLDAAAADALGELGITTLHPAAQDTLAALAPANATLEGHDYGATIDVTAATDDIAALAPAAVTQCEVNFNFTTGQFDQIFAFGLGERASLVGLNRAFKEAPLHTPGEGSAATTYARYAILVGYEVASGEAQFIGVTCIDDKENFNNINRNLGEFFEAGN